MTTCAPAAALAARNKPPTTARTCFFISFLFPYEVVHSYWRVGRRISCRSCGGSRGIGTITKINRRYEIRDAHGLFTSRISHLAFTASGLQPIPSRRRGAPSVPAPSDRADAVVLPRCQAPRRSSRRPSGDIRVAKPSLHAGPRPSLHGSVRVARHEPQFALQQPRWPPEPIH
jgi:hypothetical protein